MMQEITGEPPAMWGSSIISFGAYHYRYAGGHEGDSALARLGPHKTGKGCLYIRRLDDVDDGALRELIGRSVRVRKGVDWDSALRAGRPVRCRLRLPLLGAAVRSQFFGEISLIRRGVPKMSYLDTRIELKAYKDHFRGLGVRAR